jgi:hypothetical protein
MRLVLDAGILMVGGMRLRKEKSAARIVLAALLGSNGILSLLC